MRQLTLACARCGSAFGAWPALTIVATHVVRSMLFQLGFSAHSRSRRRLVRRVLSTARMSAADEGRVSACASK